VVAVWCLRPSRTTSSHNLHAPTLGEIITRIAFPVPRRSGYAKFRQQASHFALVGVFVAQFADGSVRVAVTGAAPRISRASDIEAALRDNFTAAAAEQVRITADGLNSGIHASPDYRAHLIASLPRARWPRPCNPHPTDAGTTGNNARLKE
jgi:CO/xanthine dehydrogenase FAD-binding subunit